MKNFKKNLYGYAVLTTFLSGFGGMVFSEILLIPLIVICLVGPFVFREVKYR